MKPKTGRRAFTLIELLVVVTIIGMLAGGAYLGYAAQIPGFRARQTATQAKVVHGWLVAYANDHGGNFPEGDTANMAYRELFKTNVGADENQFAIPGDPWHKAAPKGAPDGDTGGGPDFTQALETGECALAYVSGLASSDASRLPLVANGFTETPGVWTRDKKVKGGALHGKFGVICRVGGSSVAHALEDGVWAVKEKSRGTEMNVFTSGFEDTTFTVVNPQ